MHPRRTIRLLVLLWCHINSKYICLCPFKSKQICFVLSVSSVVILSEKSDRNYSQLPVLRSLSWAVACSRPWSKRGMFSVNRGGLCSQKGAVDKLSRYARVSPPELWSKGGNIFAPFCIVAPLGLISCPKKNKRCACLAWAAGVRPARQDCILLGGLGQGRARSVGVFPYTRK